MQIVFWARSALRSGHPRDFVLSTTRYGLAYVARGAHSGAILQHVGLQTTERDDRQRLSRFWTPTGGIEATDELKDDSHSLLIRGGFLRQTHAGLFQLLPLGLRVQEKLEKLLDKHMARLGASKIAMSTLSSRALWARSGRISQSPLPTNTPEIFMVKDRGNVEFLLSPTHEEEITKLVADTVKSYKELPLRLYQITRKYRDEARSRQGLLRTREFLMKDLYTFDAGIDDALLTYQTVQRAYTAFFDEFKLPYVVAKAASGAMGGDLSHEYHFPNRKGEDRIINCHSCGFVANEEVAGGERSGYSCAQCSGGHLMIQQAIEIGHTFFLGTRYTRPLGATVYREKDRSSPRIDSNGVDDQSVLQMGCHGIGVSRLIGAVADMLADSKGLNWPRVMSPFEAIIIPTNKISVQDQAQVYDALTATQGRNPELHDVVLDDRMKDLGWKMKDADMIGYPVIIVIGRAWQKGHEKCEVQCRRIGVKEEVPLDELRNFVADLLDRL